MLYRYSYGSGLISLNNINFSTDVFSITTMLNKVCGYHHGQKERVCEEIITNGYHFTKMGEM